MITQNYLVGKRWRRSWSEERPIFSSCRPIVQSVIPADYSRSWWTKNELFATEPGCQWASDETNGQHSHYSNAFTFITIVCSDDRKSIFKDSTCTYLFCGLSNRLYWCLFNYLAIIDHCHLLCQISRKLGCFIADVGYNSKSDLQTAGIVALLLNICHVQ